MSDHREILNEAEVDFLLAGAAEEEIPTGPETAGEDYLSPTATMHGDLDQIALADIFQTLGMSKMEGVLRVRNPLEEREVFCRDGYVRILVPPRLTARRLGQRLVQAGRLQPEELRTALLEQRKEKRPLGQILLSAGLIEQDALDEILGMQVAEDLFALFTWKHGTFEFFKGNPAVKGVPARFHSCPEYEVNSLLLEVARRSDEWQSILDALGSLDEIPLAVAAPADPEALSDAHRAVLEGADGYSTYRQIADQTTLGLFEAARAARDLCTGKILRPIDDPAMISVATRLAEEGEGKRAIVLLQTLRDRPGDRSLGIIKGMAQVLEQVGERRFASSLLLEAAQRSPMPEDALERARAARNLVPYDPGTLSFLRTVLVAHEPPDSPELEKCTIDLIDALIDADLVPTALEIVEDARRTDTLQPQILLREARARQRARDPEGAVEALLELAEHYRAEDDRTRTIETLESILRIDRSRRDVHKQLVAMRRTRLGTIVRMLAAMLVATLIGGMGFVWWQQHAYELAVDQATDEISALLDKGARAEARERLGHWRAELGHCEAVEDMASRVAFAEAAERQRLERVRRARVNERLTEAAEALGRGDLRDAFARYAESHAERGLEEEVRDVVTTRVTALLEALDRTAEQLRDRIPPPPSEVFDRKELATNLAALRKACPETLLRAYTQLAAMTAERALPEFLDRAVQERVPAVLAEAGPDIERARELTASYVQALERNETHRRLDPMFKAAVKREAEYDFVGALELYRELEQQPTGDADLRTHFRDRVARNATITRLMDELANATKAGDYETAHQQLRALRVSFPDIPFDELVRLPLLVVSEPVGATVTCNGEVIGKTPLLLARVPAHETRIDVAYPGFDGDQHTVAGDGDARWTGRLILRPDAEWRHGSAIELPPIATPDGGLVFVDRSGAVLRVPTGLGKATWRFDSQDLSGWLTNPLLDGDQLVFASLDGTLRAIGVDDGRLAWSLGDLPCEVAPVQLGRTVALATTDGRLHLIDLEARRRASADLKEPAYGALHAAGNRVFVVGERGLVSCWQAPELTRVWQRQLPEVASPRAALVHDLLIAGDDQGRVFGLDVATGEVRWQRDLGTATLGQMACANQIVWLSTPDRVLRIDARNGADLAPFARPEKDWAGPPTIAGQRVIVPLRGGPLQVLHGETGACLYRLAGDKRSRVLVVGDRVLVARPDHVVHGYGPLR